MYPSLVAVIKGLLNSFLKAHYILVTIKIRRNILEANKPLNYKLDIRKLNTVDTVMNNNIVCCPIWSYNWWEETTLLIFVARKTV